MIVMLIYLSIAAAQHRILKAGETRRGEHQVPLTAFKGQVSGEARAATVELNRNIRLRSQKQIARQESWTVYVLFEPTSGLYWWNYSTGVVDQSFNISGSFVRYGGFYLDQNAITLIRPSGASLLFRTSTARATSFDEAIQKAIAALDQLLPEINNDRVTWKNKPGMIQWFTWVSLAPLLGREFFELPGLAFTPEPRLKILSVSLENSGWRVSFTGPNRETATVRIDSTLQKVEIVERLTPPQ